MHINISLQIYCYLFITCSPKSITGYLLNIYRLFLLQLVCDINALFISRQIIAGHPLKIKLYQEDLGSVEFEEINFNHVQLRFC